MYVLTWLVANGPCSRRIVPTWPSHVCTRPVPSKINEPALGHENVGSNGEVFRGSPVINETWFDITRKSGPRVRM